MSFNISSLLSLHKKCLEHWYNHISDPHHEGLFLLAKENHHFNYQLWNAEDRARRDDQGPEFVYRAKREIDYCNQQRNNRMEAMDEWFFQHLQPTTASQCPVHSETPGMMIDRLSILSLKSYHMAIQTKREDVDATHRAQCAHKLEVINQQLKQLALCLDLLITEVQAKTRTFRVYHQFKMYNDPRLNPQLYGGNA